ncbi:MAG: hypothetical protein BZY80_01385 [SAR202 cluster bacterium Io17-Chloro-G2]|nr:MAG: hypothetical protein BZY80_01385 [SAR202 cluster bacterium Io17-Chloro-G2]
MSLVNWPLSAKLTVVVTILIVAAVLSVTALSIHREQGYFRSELEQQAQVILESLEVAAVDSLYRLDKDTLADIAQRLREKPNIVSIRFYDEAGRVLADPDDMGAARRFQVDTFGQRLASADSLIFQWQDDRLIAGLAVIAGPQRLGAISVGLSTAALGGKLGVVRNQGIIVALVTAAVGVLLALLWCRTITNPLRELARAAENIGAGNLPSRIPVRRGDELGKLTGAFNDMGDNLRLTLASLHQSRDRLEIEVHNRTAELSNANESLRDEIAHRRLAEEQIRASLREKEVMLKEINHRVKNNMQIISSLLNLQSRNFNDEQTLRSFQVSQDRIKAMALVHEKLYQSDDLARIDFGEYIKSLATDLGNSYGLASRDINLNIDVVDILLGVDTAIPCGVIVNELVANSLKHAFSGGQPGEITISFREVDRQYKMVFKDNGVGFPEDLDISRPSSLGLTIVKALTGQLGGTIRLGRKGGSEISITFPDKGLPKTPYRIQDFGHTPP